MLPGTIIKDPNGNPNFEFVAVGPGTFKMGSPNSEANRNRDETQHSVTITKPFQIQTTEVTQSLYEKITGKNPSTFKGLNRPVENVSWNDTQDFIAKLNERPEIKQSGFKYRLPTESEWEYAARGGNVVPENKMQSAYSFGDDPVLLGNFGWFTENSDGQTQDVKDLSKNANPLRMHGIHGNVSEWVEDTYRIDYENLSSKDPQNNLESDIRVVRGGNWFNDAQDLRTAKRDSFNAEFSGRSRITNARDARPGKRGTPVAFRFPDIGFRLVRTPH